MNPVILVATNDERARYLLGLTLETSHDLIQVRTVRDMLDALRDKPIDIAMIDIAVSDEEEQDSRLSRLLSDVFTVDRYVIVMIMAPDVTAEFTMRAQRQGAYCTISKPIDKYEVMAKVEGALRFAGLLEELRLKSEIGIARSTASLSTVTEAEKMRASQCVPSGHATNRTHESLRKLVEATVNIRDAEKLYSLIIEAVTYGFTVSQAALVLLEEDGYGLKVQASRGLDQEFLNTMEFRADEGIYSWLWRNGRVLFADEMGSAAGIEELGAIRREAGILQAKLCVPLGRERKPLGYLSLGAKFAGGPFGAEELEFIFAFAGYVAVAIENTLSFGRYKKFATRDELTQLFNRRYWRQYLETEVDRSKRYKRRLSVAIFDIDYFKNVNDTFGHPTGDRVLKAVARFMLESSRGTDIVGRYGGEEFIVILPETEAEVASAYCERVRRGVEEQLGKEGSGEFAHPGLTISGGMTAFIADTDTFDSVIKRADEALLKAKAEGRNRVVTL